MGRRCRSSSELSRLLGRLPIIVAQTLLARLIANLLRSR